MEISPRMRLAGLGVAVALVLLELLWRRHARRGYDARAVLASLGVWSGHAVAGVGHAAVVGTVFMAAWRAAPVQLPTGDWRTWVAAFFAVEFAYYWFHRWSHTVRWLWATHSVHHSAEELTLPAAIRLGWTHTFSGGWLVYVPLVLAGFHPGLVVALLAINLKYQFLLHTEAIGRLGVLEWVFNTPAHHRVHHACNPSCLDRNYGGMLIVFDRWFGTFAEAPKDEPLRYGLLGGSRTHNPLRIALGEWLAMWRDFRAAGTARQKLRVLLAGPGAVGDAAGVPASHAGTPVV
jgi:sterol desaturase/sphingolipid hydroxylase (fatty acid hydroxylase superfamily)